MATPRIFITGSGAVCGSGNSPRAIFDALREGRSSIAPIRMWDTTDWPVKVAAEIADFNPRALVEDRKLHKFIRRTDMLGIFAGSQAVEAAGFTQHRESLPEHDAANYNDRSGCYVGSGGGAYSTQYEYFPLMTEAGGDLKRFGEELSNVVNPMWLLRTLPNNVLCHTGIKYNLKGPNACITNHSCGGTLAVIEAMEALRTGEADRAVAIGHDTLIEPQMVLYYHGCGLLASETIRPFDAERDGSLFGEGAGALALETEASVRERRAKIIGEALGGGHVSEASGLLAIREDGDGLVRAMNDALRDAEMNPSDVGMIVAHGNGTPQSDASEAAAIRRVFGNASPPITAVKWSIGHLIAAAGIIETAIALEALAKRIVPGIATLNTLDPDCGGLPISSDAQVPRSNTALVLCRGFAGTDAALIIRGA